MQPITCLWESVQTLFKNPFIFLGSFFISVFVALLLAFQPLANETLVSSIMTIAFLPFALGGTYGTVKIGLRNEASDHKTFFTEALDNYGTLFKSFLIIFLIPQIILQGSQPLFDFLFSGGENSAVGLLTYSLDPSILFLSMAFFAASTFVVSFTLLFLFQFYDVAIVLYDTGVITSFQDSYDAVTQNLAGVAGYTIVRVGLFVAMYLPLLLKIYFDALTHIQQGRNTEAVRSSGFDPTLAAAIIISWTLVGGVLYTYHTVYYKELSSHSDNEPD